MTERRPNGKWKFREGIWWLNVGPFTFCVAENGPGKWAPSTNWPRPYDTEPLPLQASENLAKLCCEDFVLAEIAIMHEALGIPDQTARIAELEAAMVEALDGWEYAASYKGDFLRKKHGDEEDIARLRLLLPKNEETK